MDEVSLGPACRASWHVGSVGATRCGHLFNTQNADAAHTEHLWPESRVAMQDRMQ